MGRREGGIRARAEAPGLRGWRLPLRELPRAASGLWVVLALGVSGVGDGLVPRGGGGARGGGVGLCGVVSSVRRRSPSCPWRAVLPGARPAPPPPPASAVPSFPAARPRSVPAPRPPPVALALSGRAARARGRVRGCVRAPGTRAPAATRGTPRRLPAAARSPPGLWPCRGSSPRCARARPVAAVGAGGDKGGGCAVRPSPVWASASARAPTPPTRPAPRPPVRRPRPVRPVTAGSCSRPRPASVSPSLCPPAARCQLPAAAAARRRRRLPEGGTTGGRGAWLGCCVCVCVGKGRGGAPGRSAAGLFRVPFSGPSSRVPSPRARVRRAPSETRPQIRRGDPLNLSILVSGGKETNQDSLSNGE